jgi:ATP-dependent DNA helicase MPH1
MSLEACSGVGSSKGFDFASRPPERDPQSPPPAKRRRLAAAEPEDTDDISDDGSEFDAALGSDWGSLSSPRLSAAGEEAREADDDDLPESRPKPPRYKIYEPKTRTVQEPMFVTQLTQPASSPSRIRGPRWKKPDQQTDRQSSPMQSSPQAQSSSPTPPPFPAEADAGNAQPNDESIYSDDDMRAAIAASLECFREEESFRSLGTVRDDSPAWNLEQNLPLHASALGTANALSADTSFLEDIPDDAFDTSPEVSPQQTVRNPLPSIPQQRHPRPPGSSQQQMRQTTLLGGFARNQVPSSQGVSRTWKLSSQAQSEAPTHHRLDPEALACWVFPANLGRRREYQYNISQRALFHNLLVALPTGLGKTFIAATVMLNWYRWTLDAQIVFVAPTKPLVSQQVGACFNIVGIPKSRTTMLTGEAPPAVREDEWKTKRVFFMTPQTLINDLKTGIADPKRIVLLVVDEAHRATGAYAYTQVIQFLRMFNPSFRVLALTATPGSTVESVQQVIDNLNISRVEIRTESSIDIREYVHSRNVEVQTFENSEEMAKVMGLFAKALQPAVNKLCGLNAFWNKDPMSLTPYGLTQARRQWMGSAAAKHNKAIVGMVNALFTVLASLAHSVDLLKYHGISPFYRSIASFESSAQAGKGKTAQQIADDKNFKEMMDEDPPVHWTSEVGVFEAGRLEPLSGCRQWHDPRPWTNCRRYSHHDICPFP